MIKTFGSNETEQIWNGIRQKKIPPEIQKTGRRKLRMINNSIDLNDLRIPPSNRLEKLRGDLKQYYSIRINDRWRIIFIWDIGNACEVQIRDHHK
jgi:proteic killer suppression protein